jgi:hypothetical protein
MKAFENGILARGQTGPFIPGKLTYINTHYT